MSRPRWPALLLLLLPGCGEEGGGELRFAGLADAECGAGATALFGKVPVRLALAGDGKLEQVSLTVDGGQAIEDKQTPFQFELDTSQLADGNVVLEATGKLVDGGERSATIRICVDNNGPKLELLAPAAGSTGLRAEDAVLTVRARATDPSGLELVTASLHAGGSFQHADCTPPGVPDLTCSLEPARLSLPLQPNQTIEAQLVVTARDKLGRESRLDRPLTLGTRLLWSHHVGAPVQWGAVVSPKGLVIVGTDAGTVVVVDTQSLQTSCTFTAPAVNGKADSVATPLTLSADGSSLYFATLNNLYAVSPDTCNKLWSATGLFAASQPALDEIAGVVYIGSYGTQAESGSLRAYGAASGSLLGSHAIAPVDEGVTSSPALTTDGQRVYIGSSDFQLYAVDVSKPAQMVDLWAYATAGKVETRPLVTPSRVYVAGSGKDSAIHAVDQGGQRDTAFNFSAQAGFFSSPRLGPGGLIYAGSLDGKLYAVDATSGKTVASYDTGRMIRAEPAFGPDGSVLAVSVDPGRLYAFTDKLALLWSAAPVAASEQIKASPVISGTAAYIVTTNGYLHAYDASAPGS